MTEHQPEAPEMTEALAPLRAALQDGATRFDPDVHVGWAAGDDQQSEAPDPLTNEFAALWTIVGRLGIAGTLRALASLAVGDDTGQPSPGALVKPQPRTGASEPDGREGEIPARMLAAIRNVDAWLDSEAGDGYGPGSLAQDWGRVAKAAEEVGEAIAALIAMTGQNPRKGVHGTLDDLLGELGDVAVTGIFAIQHFTKNEHQTGAIVMAAMEKAASRAAAAGYE